MMLSTLWPSITEAVTQQFVMQMVPQMMADAAKNYGAGVLTGLELLEFDLGAVSVLGSWLQYHPMSLVGSLQGCPGVKAWTM
jgi:hypothetical protein